MATMDRLGRAAAAVALGTAAAAVLVMAAAVRVHPWTVPGVLVALPAAVAAGWHVVSRRGLVRAVGAVVVLAAIVLPALHVLAHRPAALAVSTLLLALSMASARFALLPTARRPRRVHRYDAHPAPFTGQAVLLVNSGSGRRAGSAGALAGQARRAGVEVIPVSPGDDLAELAERAVRGGAEMLGVAGGDGSMAPVAAVAARHGLPFVCVPAGTRNHFALDLGLDPDDPATAISAFGWGLPYRVDLGRVNGRPFVNNVSLGVYAALVRSRHYRRSKLRAMLDEMPDVIGPAASVPVGAPAMVGAEAAQAHIVVISNNPYRLGGFGRSAWRPSLALGRLGIVRIRVDDGWAAARLAVLELFRRGHLGADYAQWTAAQVEISLAEPTAAGVDGEPATLLPPLRFESVPRCLLVRLPVPARRRSPWRLGREARQLVRAALGRRRRRRPPPNTPEPGHSAGVSERAHEPNRGPPPGPT